MYVGSDTIVGTAGAELSAVYVYVFTLLAFHAGSHAITFNVVVLVNDWSLHAVLLQFGVPLVLYLTVPSLLVVLHVTALLPL